MLLNSSEALLLYVLALASPVHPLPPESYRAWLATYEWKEIYGHEFVYAGPLCIHQLSHAWKALVEEETEQILGAHILGAHAEEVINLFGLAMRHGLHASDLKSMIYAYPTKASDISYMV